MKKLWSLLIIFALICTLAACSGNENDAGRDSTDPEGDAPELINITEHSWFPEDLLAQVGASGLKQPDGSYIHDRSESQYEYRAFLSPLSQQEFNELVIEAFDLIKQNNGTVYKPDFEQQLMQKTELTEADLETGRIFFLYRVDETPYQLLLEYSAEETYHFPENTVTITFSNMSGDELDGFSWE